MLAVMDVGMSVTAELLKKKVEAELGLARSTDLESGRHRRLANS